MLLFYLFLPFYLKNSNFLYWMVPYHTQIYPDKVLGCKNWYFDIVEKNVIFCVLEMAALGATLMTVSITGFLKMLDNTAGNLTTDSSNKINKSESKWYSNDSKMDAKHSWKSPTSPRVS